MDAPDKRAADDVFLIQADDPRDSLPDCVTITGHLWSCHTPSGPAVNLSLVWDEEGALSIAVTVPGVLRQDIHVAGEQALNAHLANALRAIPRALERVALGVAPLLLIL
jgi:hypothetical protein